MCFLNVAKSILIVFWTWVYMYIMSHHIMHRMPNHSPSFTDAECTMFTEALHISHRWKRVDAGNRLSLTSDASSTTCLMFKQWTAFKLKPHPPGQRRSIYLLYFIIASSFNVTDAKTAVLTWTNDPLVPTHCCAGNRI